MSKQTVRFALLLLFALLVSAPPCWAKATGYLYIVGYSFAEKRVYLSKVIIQKVRDVSYSDEEYVTEVELIQKMESQFQKHLASTTRLNPTAYTISVRGAYKTKAIAERRLKTERERFLKKGYSAKVLSDFNLSD